MTNCYTYVAARTRSALLMGCLAMVASPAAAQQFGAGSLTSTLTDTEPTTGVINLGRMRIAPGMVVSELGTDDNVFNESENPKKDWVFRGRPDVSMFTKVRFAQLSTYVGSELVYYDKYKDQRSAGLEYRGRLDVLGGRLRPFIGGGHTRVRNRPTSEIDTRSERTLQEVSAGVGYDLGTFSRVYFSAIDFETRYRDAFEEGVELSDSLNQDNRTYSIGVQTALTPLATLTASGGIQQDRFKHSPLRNSERKIGDMQLLIRPEAVLSGEVSLSYQAIDPVDPLIEPFRGVTTRVGVTYALLEIGRINVSLLRGFEYSFDESEGYYKELTASLSYTHRLFNEFDFQLNGSLSWLDYGYRVGTPARRDELDSAAGSLGYNFRNRTRVALNYESARRRSVVFPERDYDRHRWFFSWLYAF
jgi:hypothetical protein